MGFRPAFTVSPRLLAALERIAALRERLLAAAVQVPWLPLLQRDARERNTHASTAIEGNPLGLAEVSVLAEGRDLASANARAKREVLNYLAALRHIDRRRGWKRLAHDDVLALHSIIMRGVLAPELTGRYRPYGVRVGTHVAPPAERVHALMTDLFGWADREAVRWPPVISSAVMHHRFEDIHPFADGNGRTGRALALWELYRRGFDTLHVFPLDDYYWEHRSRYYEALAAPRHRGGDLTSWIEFVAEAMETTLTRVIAQADRLAVKAKRGTIVLRPKQERLLDLLRERRSLAPAEIWAGLGVSRQGALDLLNPLIKAGLVKRIGTRKSGRYVLG